jgi:hypothetical protein
MWQQPPSADGPAEGQTLSYRFTPTSTPELYFADEGVCPHMNVTSGRSEHQRRKEVNGMTKIAVARFKLIPALVLCCAISVTELQAQPPTMDTNRKPVLVELFTSEGCSSCPPADALLQKLLALQPVAGAEIIPLEEHVDYWNHDGWVDPYSSAQWTQRQSEYGAFFGNGAYTPELVVNGTSQFVGSNQQEALAEIAKAAQSSKTEVSITPEKPNANGSQHFTVTTGKIDTKGDVAEVWLAVTEDGLHSSVERGENAGHVLNHVATLRSLQKIGVADAKGAAAFTKDAVLKFDSRWNLENVRVSAFVQKRKSREILGAASTKIK